MSCLPTSLLTKRIIKPPRLRKGLVKTEFMAPKKDTGETPSHRGGTPSHRGETLSHRGETSTHRGETPSHRGNTPGHRGNSPSKKEKSSRVNVKKKGKPALDAVSEGALEDGDDTNFDGIDDTIAVAAHAAQTGEAEAEAAGNSLTEIVRVRGGGCAASKRRAQVDPFVQHQDDLSGSRDPVQPNALEDGDDTNLDDIDDDAAHDDAARPTKAMGAQSELISPLPPKLHQALTELDKIVIQVLLCGAIRLLCVKWLLMQPDNFKMPNRQELEALEKSGASPSPLLSGEAAAALVRRGDRSIGALTYGWLMSGDPDPAGSRIRVLRRALARLAIEALFWDFGSLYQAPRTPEQKEFFEMALKGGAMNQLYASILATTVLQIEEIPPRPAEFDGVVCLFKLSSNVDESVVRAALVGFGTIESCDLSRSPAIVRFTSHASAVAAKDAGAPPGLCEGLDTLYNETPYFSRGW
jgi:hypothetical protein